MTTRYYKWPRNNRIMITLNRNMYPWHLVMHIPLRFHFYNGSSYVRQWTSKEYKWCKDFEKFAEQVFSNKYLLHGKAKNGKSLPRFSGVRIDVSHVDYRAKNVIEVFIYDNKAKGRSVAKIGGRSFATKRNGIKLIKQQRAAIHELGHIMGLAHTGCTHLPPGQRNHSRCYVGNGLMGLGMTITKRDYQMFATFLESLDKSYRWSVA